MRAAVFVFAGGHFGRGGRLGPEGSGSADRYGDEGLGDSVSDGA